MGTAARRADSTSFAAKSSGFRGWIGFRPRYDFRMPSKISRRNFLSATAAGLSAIGAGNVFGINSQKTRPNVLLIMSDEHNRAVAGCYADRTVQTPHIDSLAQTGV